MTATFHIYTSSNPAVLARELAERLRQPLSQPLAAEWLIVDSLAQKEWLAQYLAEALGISANLTFPFPRRALWQLLRRLLPDSPTAEAPDLSSLSWQLFRLLPQHLAEPEFKALAFYLQDDQQDIKLSQLAQKLAPIFDVYPIYRPDLIHDWESGQNTGSAWQAILWRHLQQAQATPHRLFWQQRFLQALGQAPLALHRLPERICLFGLQTLPAFYVDMLAALAEVLPVYVFQWQVRRPDDHPLLAANGLLSHHYQHLLAKHHPKIDALPAAIPLPSRRLHWLQTLIHQPSQSLVMPDETQSLQIHSYHSPLRELEGLRDYLWQRFEQDPTLKPHQIAILAPELASYQSLLPWVFPPQEEQLPVRLTQSLVTQESPVFKALLYLLQLVPSRVTLPDVLGLLELEAVYPAFKLSAVDVWRCRQWLDAVHVRWGINGIHRTNWDLPAFEENTWQQGLERLLLGYALPPSEETLYAGCLPYAHVEGQEAQILGHLLDFTSRLFDLIQRFQVPKTLAEWAETLRPLPTQFLKIQPAWEPDLTEFEYTLQQLTLQQQHYPGPVALDLVLPLLSQQWQNPSSAMRLGRQIPFGTLAELRGLPYRVICVLGLNEGVFPKPYHPPAFDLMVPPQPGDAWPGWLERDCFLQALCAAQDYLYLSYQGQRPQDNSVQPPSLVISELLTCLGEPSPIRHPLHPFGARYFNQTGLFSYDAKNYQLCQLLEGQPHDQPFLTGPLPITPPTHISLAELRRFWHHPVRYWMQNQLRLFYPRAEAELGTTEFFELDTLQQWQLKQVLLAHALKGKNLADIQASWICQGILPVGQVGRRIFKNLQQDVTRFVQALIPFRQPVPASEPFTLELGPYLLDGDLDGLQPHNRLAWRLGRLREEDLIDNWICHLVLSLLKPESTAKTRLLATAIPAELDFAQVQEHNGCFEAQWHQPSQPAQLMTQLLELYQQGQTQPLPFFVRSSWIYLHCYQVKPEQGPKALQQTWNGSEMMPGEVSDPWLARCYGQQEPFDTQFESVAQTIYGPLWEANACPP